MTRQTAAEIEEEAAAWVMRIDREGLTPELSSAMDHWLAGDSRRRGAWIQAEAAWLVLDRLNEAESDAAGRAQSTERSSFWKDLHSAQQASETVASGSKLTRRRLLVGGGASALTATLIGSLKWFRRDERHDTALGEISRVPLADGSTAAINTHSLLTVAFASRERSIRLERGEAWFQVARDADRPFIVKTGKIRIVAVGTAFGVRRRDNGADVLVTEGAVQAWADGADGARVRLIAGQRAFVGDNAAVVRAATAPADLERALAWRSGRIDLAGETLIDAAEEFNRYNRKQILITDPRLATERFFGTFRTNDPEGFALAVHGNLGVPVRSDAGKIEIGRPAP